MKSSYFKFRFFLNPIVKALPLLWMAPCLLLGSTYNPQTGNTRDPNGTIYLSTSQHSRGLAVTGKERINESWESLE